MNENGKKKASKSDKIINAVIVLVIAAFVAAGAYAAYGKISEGIKDRAIASGEAEATVEYLAKQANMTAEDYLAQYGLSLGDTINNDTTQSEMLDNMTIENYAKFNGQDADEMINGTGLQDKVTKDTLWKDFLPQVPVVSVLGEDTFNQVKEQMGFGDELAMDTPYGEFEKMIEEKQNELSSAEPSGEPNADGETPAEEAPAEETAGQE